MGRAVLALSGALIALFASIADAAAQSGKLEYAYIVLGGQGAIARTILSGTAECPTVDLGGAVEPMTVRASPDVGEKPSFPVLVCEALIPTGATSATIRGRKLPLPKPSLARIATFGDTGCRMEAAEKGKAHDHYEAEQFQNCNDGSKWPFARLSKTVAARKPDLVIHVGDYLYRESPCPKDKRGCKGSPFGDNWPAWQADFFTPAKPLLAAAAWIMVRGNHETCGRGGLGYFRFLDPELARDHSPPACVDIVPPYAVNSGGKSFLVMDTSHAADTCGDSACDSAPYAAQFASLKPKPGAWFLSHRPVWGIGRTFVLNQTLQQALKPSNGRLPDGIELALSGHMHIFELLSFTDQRPPQLVVGTGGTLLDKKIDRRFEGMTLGDATVRYGRSVHRFGFLMIAPQNDGSTATFVESSGRQRMRCALTPTSARCE